jgi:hypothetical protein
MATALTYMNFRVVCICVSNSFHLLRKDTVLVQIIISLSGKNTGMTRVFLAKREGLAVSCIKVRVIDVYDLLLLIKWYYMFKVKPKDMRDCGHVSKRDKMKNMYTT